MQDKNSLEKALSDLLKLTNKDMHPNINVLWKALKDIDVLRLNIKNFGYQLARDFVPIFSNIKIDKEPRIHGLVSKPTTQSDIESPWFQYWCKELNCSPIYHRKLWEFAFVLQVLYEHHLIRSATKGIGFGCGEEPLASYFAKNGIYVTVTDLPPNEAFGKGWLETAQYGSSLTKIHDSDIVDYDTFLHHVDLRYVDMNSIPNDLTGYDFCWSVCSLEHLGSINKGLQFIQESLKTLKIGGVAVHTTEFNYLSMQETIDNWSTVLFRKQDFEVLAKQLRKQGHSVLGIDYNVGNQPLDRFIDVPPYSFGEGWLNKDIWQDTNQYSHLKLSIDGFPSTCMGIIVIKGV